MNTTNTKKKIAIIGGGTGLTLAWLLKDSDFFEVTLFERNDRLGGHINSIELETKTGDRVIVESGAEFINPYYTYFLKLMDHLKIQMDPFLMKMRYTSPNNQVYFTPNPFEKIISDISNGHSDDAINFSNQFKLFEIIERFKKTKNKTITLENWCRKNSYEDFAEEYLYHFVASSWGVSEEEARNYLVGYALNYFSRGNIFLEATNGLSSYIEKLSALISNKCNIKLNCDVTLVTQDEGKYTIHSGDQKHTEFDHVVFCTNAEISAKIIGDHELAETLKKVRYYDTKIVFEEPEDKPEAVINIDFDGKSSRTTVCKSWKHGITKRWAREDETPEGLAVIYYRHPHMDICYYNVQEKLKEQNKKDEGILFGSILAGFDDSHESGIRTSVNIARQLFKKYNIEPSNNLVIFNEKTSCCC